MTIARLGGSKPTARTSAVGRPRVQDAAIDVGCAPGDARQRARRFHV